LFSRNRKRKAEASPLKNDRVKRCALTNLTNNLKKNDVDDNTKKVGLRDVSNAHPVSYRTRAAAAAGTIANVVQLLPPPKPILKPTKKIKASTSEPDVTEQKSKPIGTTILKSKTSTDVPNKASISTRRISNEFEKTEDSLYVSALEEIPADISRFSDKTKSSITSIESLLSQASSSFSSVASSQSDNIVSSDWFGEFPERKLPAGYEHFDRENWNDPSQVSAYAMDIFEYYRNKEEKYKMVDYMGQQPELSKWMRSLLVDWMVEVQESFELNHETLYLAVKIVDSYLGKERVSKDSLQLLGAAALLIACKYDVSKRD
jgi:hypothetical protein